MASSDTENYWRTFLLLEDGGTMIARSLLTREIDKTGVNLKNLLFEKKEELKRKLNNNQGYLEMLFPKEDSTDVPDMFQLDFKLTANVLLVLFSTSLEQVERQGLRKILHAQADVENCGEKTSLDDTSYLDIIKELTEAMATIVGKLGKEFENKIAKRIELYSGAKLSTQVVVKHVKSAKFPNSVSLHIQKFLDFFSSNMQNDAEEALILVDSRGVITDMITTCCVEANTEDDNAGDTEIIYERHSAEQNPTSHEDVEVGSTTEENELSIGSETGDTVNDITLEHVIPVPKTKTEAEAEPINSVKQWTEMEIEENLKRKDFSKSIKDKLQQWAHVTVDIAVVGRTGVGKSRFINAIRGCDYKTHPGYAPVGSVEETDEAKEYCHPQNNLVRLFDLPGFGTQKFPKSEYVKSDKVKFDNYDIYIIMATDRLTEDDFFLVEHIEKIGKKCIFVRNRVDIQLDGVEDPEHEVDVIRKDCQKILANTRIKNKDVYLISSKLVDHRLLDFDKLLERLIDDLPGLKKEALLLSLEHDTGILIDKKEQYLRKRIVKVGAVSAMGGAVPIPVVSFFVDMAAVVCEVHLYRKTLKVTIGNLELLSKTTGISTTDLMKKYNLKTFDYFKMVSKDVTKVGSKLAPYFAKLSASEAVENVARTIPIVGSTIGATLSYCTTVCFLRSSLEMMVQDARKMLQVKLEHSEKNVMTKTNIEK